MKEHELLTFVIIMALFVGPFIVDWCINKYMYWYTTRPYYKKREP